MKPQNTTTVLLSTIALLLFALVARPLWSPQPVSAQAAVPSSLHFEPGVYMLRAADGRQQVLGRVAINLRTGNVWGFPTLSQDPYPGNPLESKAKTSHPFLLGRFAVEEATIK